MSDSVPGDDSFSGSNGSTGSDGTVHEGDGGGDEEEHPDGAGPGEERPGSEEVVTVEEGPGGREVVVPMAVYKRVTVVSTLVAMVCIVGGFALLDRATNRATLPVDEVNPWLALAGLGLIAFGGLTYAYSTRFRAAGMGSSKTDEDRPTDDG